jgi:diguanylate cyclase (GGDEF)-like protein
MSVTDGLTGLYNIRYFKMLLETEIMFAKMDPHKKFSIIMGDIDHFKHFNDRYGHQVGDLVLKEVGAVLKASVRSLDMVARYGGEEMIILLRGALLKDGLAVAEKIRKNVEGLVIKDERGTYKVTISLGVASFAREDNVDLIIKKADDSLYRSKETGRNRVSSMEQAP